MTEMEHKVSEIDKRQESFETFVRAYIDSNEKHMAEMRVDIREINSKLDNIGRHTQNLAVAAMAGIGAISVSVAIFVASAVAR